VLNAASEKIGELFHRHEERHKNIDISTSTARQTNEQSQRHHMWRTCWFTTWLFADVLVQAQLVHAQQDITWPQGQFHKQHRPLRFTTFHTVTETAFLLTRQTEVPGFGPAKVIFPNHLWWNCRKKADAFPSFPSVILLYYHSGVFG